MTFQAPPPVLWRLLRPQLDRFVRDVNDVATWEASFGNVTTVTSWWRSEKANARVRGNPFSLHLIGLAADVVASDLEAWEATARQAFPQVVNEGTHVHVGALPAGALRRLVLGR